PSSSLTSTATSRLSGAVSTSRMVAETRSTVRLTALASKALATSTGVKGCDDPIGRRAATATCATFWRALICGICARNSVTGSCNIGVLAFRSERRDPLLLETPRGLAPDRIASYENTQVRSSHPVQCARSVLRRRSPHKVFIGQAERLALIDGGRRGW